MKKMKRIITIPIILACLAIVIFKAMAAGEIGTSNKICHTAAIIRGPYTLSCFWETKTNLYDQSYNSSDLTWKCTKSGDLVGCEEYTDPKGCHYTVSTYECSWGYVYNNIDVNEDDRTLVR